MISWQKKKNKKITENQSVEYIIKQWVVTTNPEWKVKFHFQMDNKSVCLNNKPLHNSHDERHKIPWIDET